MTGYTRKDVSNNIANGNVVNADDLDLEFDGVVAAFNNVTGHSHDGSGAEGAPITVVGPAQDVVVNGTAMTPKTDDAYDLGSSTNEWKDLYVDGTANIDNLVAEAGTVAGAAITTLSNTQTLTNKTINLGNNTLVTTSAQLATALTDETGTGSVVFSGSPALTGTPTAPTATSGTSTTQLATTAFVTAERTATATLTNKTLTNPDINTPDIDGGTIDGTVIGGLTPAAGTFTNLAATALSLGGTAVTSTAEEINKLDGFTGTASGLNTAVNHYVPSGGIILWSGAVAAIPSGWALCNGSNGTPNLSNRFIVSIGSEYGVGATGGVNTVTLTASQMPSHTHSVNINTNSAGSHDHTIRSDHSSTSPTTAYNTRFGLINGIESVAQRGGIDAAGSHSHNVSGNTGSAGSGSAHENRPPYYALAYIMKL